MAARGSVCLGLFAVVQWAADNKQLAAAKAFPANREVCMTISVPLAAAFASLPVLFALTPLRWSEPTVLRENAPGNTFGAQIASGSNGHAIVVWGDSPPNPIRFDFFVRMFTPGSGWGPTTLISDQGIPTVAMGSDGTAIAAWRQYVEMATGNQVQVVARKFVPGVGWGPVQVLSTEGSSDSPVLAMAPDGRAHIVFSE
jgi:hypothetical protein